MTVEDALLHYSNFVSHNGRAAPPAAAAVLRNDRKGIVPSGRFSLVSERPRVKLGQGEAPMPEALAFLASMVATFALLIVLGFSVFLAALAFKTTRQPDLPRRIRHL